MTWLKDIRAWFSVHLLDLSVFQFVLLVVFILSCSALLILFVRAFLPSHRKEIRKLGWDKLVQIVGAMAAVTAFLWSVSKDAESLAQARRQDASKQFSEAAKGLGEKETGTRVASIYFLGQLAKQREDFAGPAMALVKRQLKEKPIVPSDTKLDDADASEQAAVDVLRRRDLFRDASNLDLKQRTIIGGDWRGGEGISGFSNADFRGSSLYRGDFRHAKLSGARFEGTDFADWRAYNAKHGSGWQDAIPTGSDWDWQRFRYITRFDKADLKNARFNDASLEGAVFCGADLAGAIFKNANISRADFRKAKIADAKMFEEACWDQPPLFDESRKDIVATKKCHAEGGRLPPISVTLSCGETDANDD